VDLYELMLLRTGDQEPQHCGVTDDLVHPYTHPMPFLPGQALSRSTGSAPKEHRPAMHVLHSGAVLPCTREARSLRWLVLACPPAHVHVGGLLMTSSPGNDT
jgi:hypothetical protein